MGHLFLGNIVSGMNGVLSHCFPGAIRTWIPHEVMYKGVIASLSSHSFWCLLYPFIPVGGRSVHFVI